MTTHDDSNQASKDAGLDTTLDRFYSDEKTVQPLNFTFREPAVMQMILPTRSNFKAVDKWVKSIFSGRYATLLEYDSGYQITYSYKGEILNLDVGQGMLLGIMEDGKFIEIAPEDFEADFILI